MESLLYILTYSLLKKLIQSMSVKIHSYDSFDYPDVANSDFVYRLVSVLNVAAPVETERENSSRKSCMLMRVYSKAHKTQFKI